MHEKWQLSCSFFFFCKTAVCEEVTKHCLGFVYMTFKRPMHNWAVIFFPLSVLCQREGWSCLNNTLRLRGVDNFFEVGGLAV